MATSADRGRTAKLINAPPLAGRYNARVRTRPSNRKSPTVEGTVRDVTDAGDAVLETEQGIVMVHGGLPGERLRTRVTDTVRGVARGALLEVLVPSSERVAPPCALVERCGGCPLMQLSLAGQHALKLDRVRRAIRGLGSSETVEPELDAAGPALGYRRRARFAFRRIGTGLLLGYHAHASRHLVDVATCPILDPALARAWSLVRSELGPALHGSGEIELSALSETQVSCCIRCEEAAPEATYRAAEALATRDPIVSASVQVANGAPAHFGVPAQGLGIDGAPLHMPSGGFSQVNAGVNARLGARVLELSEASAARVLELYAGQGNFTVALAAQAASLVAVEGQPEAAAACRENLRARGLMQAKVIERDVAQLQLRERFDVVVLDPPRAGAVRLAELLKSAQPERVVYVSCHMTTLGRDLRTLHAQGYRVDRAYAFDMFPHTAHVEALVRMRRT